MVKINISEFRQRFDPDLCKGIVEMCISKKSPLIILYNDDLYYSMILEKQFKGDTPYMVIDSLIPSDDDEIARGRTEVPVKVDYMYKGLIFHIRFHLILYGLTEHDGMKAILSTPPLDLQIKTEGFTGRPNIENPLWVKIPLFKEEIRADVKLISVKGVIFEDRLLVDTLPTLIKYERIHLDFGDDEISIQGRYSSSGEKKIEFHFGKLGDREQTMIYDYLERLWHEHGKDKQAKNIRGMGAKKESQEARQTMPLLFLCDDDEYFKKVSSTFKKNNISLSRLQSIEECEAELFKFQWKLMLVDSKLKDIDLWDFSRRMQKISEEKEKPLPVFILLSEDMSEDSVVYAQYAGFKHIYPRTDFCEDCVRYIGSIMGTVDKSTSDLPVVLIIDDDKNITFPLEHALTKNGFMPVIATTGSEGVRYAKDHTLSCIVLEPAIRTKDGMNAARILKRLPFTKNIPMIILSVINKRKDIDLVTQLGIKAFLKKPVEITVIVEKIKSICCDKPGC